jgi:hypothetical protein
MDNSATWPMNPMRKTLLLIVFLLLPLLAQGADALGKVSQLRGSADVERGGPPARALALGDPLFEQDVVRTLSGSLLEIQLRDGSRLTLDENTRLALRQYAAEARPAGMIELFRGRLRAWVGEVFSSREESFRVRTPTAIVGVQGTDFLVAVQSLVTWVEVVKGLVSVVSSDPAVGGRILLQPGQFATVRKGQAPRRASGAAAAGTPGSGGTADLRSGGIQTKDPLLMTPNAGSGPVLPPNPNPPRP